MSHNNTAQDCHIKFMEKTYFRSFVSMALQRQRAMGPGAMLPASFAELIDDDTYA